MKSDFLVALNQISHERQLPIEVVIEALEVALVSAYKRNFGANTCRAQVDMDSGTIKIFVEKEVVDSLFDSQNEILLEEAQELDPEIELGDTIQVESMPRSFGRIAAQTTKQVVLQRIREAERDALYRSYADRQGEIVNGTVQKNSPRQTILALGKVDAVLPRNEQIPSERYREGQRLRVYIAEVSKTPRGPQIIVSRTHRNMLRRLLEVEVPEIYNGTVEIKSIAREAGSRSKVAVAALQEGVDPVGSCVGMRGVRIQSIVTELGGEKIDVTEWSPNVNEFIANALSPAKVMNVILQDITSDKTALVVVPDKQLSLAIGKEGQNARLAAKLTGWRIDIKSAMEAARDSLVRASGSDAIKARVSHRPEIFALVSDILSENEEGAELSQGELNLLSEAIELVGQAENAIAREHFEEERQAKIQARMAETADVDLLAEAAAILDVGDDEDVEAATETEVVDAVAELAVEADVEADVELVVETETEAVEADVDVEAQPTEVETSVEAEIEVDDDVDAEIDDEEAEAEEDAEQTGEGPEFIPSIFESIIEEEPVKKKKTKKRLKVVTEPEDDVYYAPTDTSKKRGNKSRTLEYDEDLGHVVVKRHRKRRTQEWDDWE